MDAASRGTQPATRSPADTLPQQRSANFDGDAPPLPPPPASPFRTARPTSVALLRNDQRLSNLTAFRGLRTAPRTTIFAPSLARRHANGSDAQTSVLGEAREPELGSAGAPRERRRQGLGDGPRGPRFAYISVRSRVAVRTHVAATELIIPSVCPTSQTVRLLRTGRRLRLFRLRRKPGR